MSGGLDKFMPLYWGDYARDTAHLNAMGHGAYLMLLKHYWCHSEPLDDDDNALWRIACCDSKREWLKVRKSIEKLFVVEDGKWTHKRVEKELAKALDISAKRKNAAKQKHCNSSANADANADANAPILKPVCTTQPQPQPQEASASSAGFDEKFNRLETELGISYAKFQDRAADIRCLTDLLGDGCNFDRHILPAAQQISRTKSGKPVRYIAPKARELRDSEKLSGSVAIPVDWPRDEDGWRTRVRVHADGKAWLAKWGPPPGAPGCKVPAHILAEFGEGTPA